MRRAAIILVATCVAIALVVPPGPGRRTVAWCDAVSGSDEWQTTWPLGITAGRRTDVSPLEVRLRAIGYEWQPVWRSVHDDYRSRIGGREISCSTAPAIVQLRPLMPQFVNAASPEELRRFADVMRAGTGQEQKAAVDAAQQKALAAIEGGSGG